MLFAMGFWSPTHIEQEILDDEKSIYKKTVHISIFSITTNEYSIRSVPSKETVQ